MFWDDNSDQAQAFSKVQNEEPHESSFTHELIAGAAAFEAQKAYMDFKEKNGAPQDHETAKELLAGFAGAAADKLFETKGLDFLDREKAKYEAKRQVQDGESALPSLSSSR
ncbi:hypothetical protein JCM8097_008544 [Rhodosporidiobolus ruineniae]